MNAYSPIWNPHCRRRRNAKPLEDFIEKFDLLVNNKSKQATKPASDGVSIIDFALSIVEQEFLTLWEIPKDYLSLSDHELILLQWEDINHDLPNKKNAIPTGWDIQSLIKFPKNLKSVLVDWISRSKSQKLLNQTSNQKNLDEEVD